MKLDISYVLRYAVLKPMGVVFLGHKVVYESKSILPSISCCFPYIFSSSFCNYICFQHVTRSILASCMSLPIITEVDKEHKGNKSKLPTDKGSSPAGKKLLEESLLSDRTSSGKPGSFTL